MYVIIGMLLSLAIVLVLFFVFRDLNCWYWKINDRVALMEEHNLLLRELLKSNNIVVDVSKMKPETVVEHGPIVVSSDEQIAANEQEAIEVTVRHKCSRKIKRVSIEFWAKMKQTYGYDAYDIIEFHK